MIHINALTKSFGSFKALDDISLNFAKGRTISLLGPNGSGKTTLIKSILGLVIPDKGTISINDKQIGNDWQYRSHIGYMPQIGRYPENMTIGQVIKMIKDIRKDNVQYDEELIKQLGVDKISSKTMRSLSGGTRQKVSACLAFLFSPGILILDEPTAGLDPLASEILKDKIIQECNKGKLVLITSHILSDLDGITNDVVYLQDGKLIFYKSVDELQHMTSETKLNKMIASVMRNEHAKTAHV